jgi:hypothetical protein
MHFTKAVSIIITSVLAPAVTNTFPLKTPFWKLVVGKILKKWNHQVFNKLADIYSGAKFTHAELEQA